MVAGNNDLAVDLGTYSVRDRPRREYITGPVETSRRRERTGPGLPSVATRLLC
jgi:hypothetical protein